MKTKIKKPCKHRGCPLLTYEDYCKFHIKLHIDDRKDDSNNYYYSKSKKSKPEKRTI